MQNSKIIRGKSFIKIAGFFALALFSFTYKIAMAQSDLTAIDVLLNPDHIMLDSAKVYNVKMRQNYPGGFALDENHTPHITVLQAFVRTADLDNVYAAVAKVVQSEKPTIQKLTASGFYYLPYKNLGLAGITINPTEKLLSFQTKIIEAIKPYAGQGTSAAFVPNKDGSEITKPTIDYVLVFVPEHSGDKYNPHVTIGLGKEAFVKEMLARPFNQFTFKIESVSIYKLGDLGTAQKKLWTYSAN